MLKYTARRLRFALLSKGHVVRALFHWVRQANIILLQNCMVFPSSVSERTLQRWWRNASSCAQQSSLWMRFQKIHRYDKEKKCPEVQQLEILKTICSWGRPVGGKPMEITRNMEWKRNTEGALMRVRVDIFGLEWKLCKLCCELFGLYKFVQLFILKLSVHCFRKKKQWSETLILFNKAICVCESRWGPGFSVCSWQARKS